MATQTHTHPPFPQWENGHYYPTYPGQNILTMLLWMTSSFQLEGEVPGGETPGSQRRRGWGVGDGGAESRILGCLSYCWIRKLKEPGLRLRGSSALCRESKENTVFQSCKGSGGEKAGGGHNSPVSVLNFVINVKQSQKKLLFLFKGMHIPNRQVIQYKALVWSEP